MTTPLKSLEHVQVEWPESHLLILQIHRPKALGALNTATLRELRELLTQAAQTETVRAVILTGSGPKSFIAGADIAEMQAFTPGQAAEFSQLGHQVTKLLELMPKPTLAAVQGYALGGGLELALACDFIVASEQATFGLPEVTLGLIPGFGGTVRLAKAIGLPRAKELIYTGRKLSASEALNWGLINHCVPAAELLTRSVAIARSISHNSLEAIRKAKHLLHECSETTGLNVKLDAETQAFSRLFGTPDQQEGVSAFLEKRKPLFKGLTPQ